MGKLALMPPRRASILGKGNQSTLAEITDTIGVRQIQAFTINVTASHKNVHVTRNPSSMHRWENKAGYADLVHHKE